MGSGGVVSGGVGSDGGVGSGEGGMCFQVGGYVGSVGGGVVQAGGVQVWGGGLFRWGVQWGERSKGANVKGIEGEQRGKHWGRGGGAQLNLFAI